MDKKIWEIKDIINSQKSVGLFKEIWIRIFGKKHVGYDILPSGLTSVVIMHEYKGVFYMLTPIRYIKGF